MSQRESGGGSGRRGGRRGSLLRQASDDPLRMAESVMAAAMDTSDEEISAPPPPAETDRQRSSSSKAKKSSASASASAFLRRKKKDADSSSAPAQPSPPRTSNRGGGSARRSRDNAAYGVPRSAAEIAAASAGKSDEASGPDTSKLRRLSSLDSLLDKDLERRMSAMAETSKPRRLSSLDIDEQRQMSVKSKPARRLSSLAIGQLRRMSSGSVHSGSIRTAGTARTGTGGGGTPASATSAMPTRRRDRRGSGLDLPMLAPPTRRGSAIVPSGEGFSAGAFHPRRMVTLPAKLDDSRSSSSSSSTSSWGGDNEQQSKILGGVNPYNVSTEPANGDMQELERNLEAAKVQSQLPTESNGSGKEEAPIKDMPPTAALSGLSRRSSVPMEVETGGGGGGGGGSIVDPSMTAPSPTKEVNRHSSLPDDMNKASYHRSSSYVRPECLDDLADNVRDSLSELGGRISTSGRSDTASRQAGFMSRRGGASSGSFGSFAFSFGAGKDPEDVDAPGLVAEAFQRLVAGLLSSSDALELSGGHGHSVSDDDEDDDDDEEEKERKKNAKKRWQSSVINTQALSDLMAQVPQVNLTFSAVKPVLVAISHEEYEEVDDSLLDGLERLARLVDLLTEIVDKVNTRQEWDDGAETTLLTLLCLTRLECDRLEDEYEEGYMGEDSVDLNRDGGGSRSSHSMGSLAMCYLDGEGPIPFDPEGGLTGGQAEWRDLLKRTWCKSGNEDNWKRIFRSGATSDDDVHAGGNKKGEIKDDSDPGENGSDTHQSAAIDPASFQEAAIDVIKSTNQWKPDCMEDLMFACHLAFPIPLICDPSTDGSSAFLEADDFRANAPEQATAILARIKDSKVTRDRELDHAVRSLVPPDALALRRGSQRNAKNLEQSLRGENDPTIVVVTSSVSLSGESICARRSRSRRQQDSLPPKSVLGKSGTGKTTLAAMVAAKEEVRWWFKGGIAWVHVGKRGDTEFAEEATSLDASGGAKDPSSTSLGTGMGYEYYRKCLLSICHQVGVDEEDIPEFEDHLLVPFDTKLDRRIQERYLMTVAKERMIHLMTERQNTLIILDDVWHSEDVDWFNFYPEQVFTENHRRNSICNPVKEEDESRADQSRSKSSGSLDITALNLVGDLDRVEGASTERSRKRRVSGGKFGAKRRGSAGIYSAAVGLGLDIEEAIEGVIEGVVGDMSGDPEGAGESKTTRRGSGGRFGVGKRRMSGGMFTAGIDLKTLESALEGSRNSSIGSSVADDSSARQQQRFGAARRKSSGGLFAGIITAAKKQSHILVTTLVHDLRHDCRSMSLDGLYENEALSLLMMESGQPANHVMRASIEARSIASACDEDCALALRTAGRWLRMLGTGNRFLRSIGEVSMRVKQCLEESSDGKSSVQIRSLPASRKMSLFDILGNAIPMVVIERWKLENPTLVRRCFASFVVVFCDKDFGSIGGAPIPLDAANILWKKILRYNEKGEDERKIAGYTDALKEELALVSNVLGPLGLVNVTTDERPDGTRERLLQVSHDLCEEYGRYLVTNSRGGIGKMDRWASARYQHAWNEAFVAGFLESRQGLPWDEGVIDGTSSSLLEYGLQRIVRHMLIADMIDDARGYLVNKGFIKGRICLLGASRGTKCHIADCKGFGELAKLSGAAHDDEFYVRDTLVLAFEEVSNCIIGQILTENNETEEEVCLDCGKAMYELGLALAEFGCEGAEEEAIGFFRKAIECVKGSTGKPTEFCAAAYVDISAIYLDKGNLEEAREALNEAINIRFKCLAEDDVRIAITLRKLADVLVLLGVKEEAASLYQEASDVAKSNLNQNRLLVAEILHAKGTFHHQEDETGMALEALRESLQWKRMELGPDEPSLALQYYAIGNILIAGGDEDGAVYNYEESIRLRKLRPSDDPMVQADLLSAEGLLHNLKKEPDKALKCLQQVLAICADLGVENDVRVAQIRAEVGELHFVQEEYEEAASCFDEVFAVRRERLGDCIEVYLTQYKLGCAQGYFDSDKAIENLEAALKGIVSSSETAENSEEAALALHELGVVNEKAGRHDAALECLTKEMEIRQSMYGNDHESIIPASFGLGLVHETLGNYSKALQCYTDVKRMNDKKPEQDGIQLTSADVLFQIGVVNSELSRFDDALEALESALRIRRSSLGYHNTVVANTILKIANVQLARGKYEAALQSFNEVLGLEYEFTVEDRVGVADTLFGKGRIYYSREEPGEALKAYEEALYWKKRVLGEDDIGLASLYEAMGHVHVDKDEVSDAVECFEKAHNLREQHSPTGVEEKAAALKARAFLKRTRGSEREGLEGFKKAYRLYESLIGSDNTHSADMQYQMAVSYFVINRYEKGAKLLESCLSTRKKILGEHMDVAITMEHLADAHIQFKEDYAKALPYLEDSIAIRRTVLKGNDNLAASLEKCGNVCKKLREPDKALSYYDEALQLKRLLHGERYTGLASTLQEMGDVMNEMGEYEQGVKCIDDAITLRRQDEEVDPADVAALLYCKGFALHHLGANDAALEVLGESLEIRQAHYGKDHFSVGDTLNMMGFLHSRKGDSDNALKCLWGALASRKACNDNAKEASTLQNIGNVHRVRREFNEAITSYEECRRIREQELGKDHAKVGETWTMLGHMHADADHVEEATRCFSEALRIRRLCYGKEDDKSTVILQKMGALHIKAGEQEKGRDCFEEFMRILKAKKKDKAEDYATALTIVGNTYAVEGNQDKAEDKWKEALKIYKQLGLGEDHPAVVRVSKNLREAQGGALTSGLRKSTQWFQRAAAGAAAGLSDEVN